MSRITASISRYSALPFTDDTHIDALLKSDVVWRGDVVGNDDVDGGGGVGGGGLGRGRGWWWAGMIGLIVWSQMSRKKMADSSANASGQVC